MNIKFTEKRLYENYPLYSKRLGSIHKIDIKKENDTVLYYQVGKTIYNTNGINTDDELFCKIPVIYTKLYSIIVLIILLIVNVILIENVDLHNKPILLIPILINIVLIDILRYHKRQSDKSYIKNLPEIRKINI